MSLRGILIETVKLPPLRWVARRTYDRFFERHRSGNHYRGVYPSYAEALRHTPTDSQMGFDNSIAAAQYRHRISDMAVSEYPVLLWLSRLLDERQRTIFDLGGHFGLFYYALQRYRQLPADLRWTVSDLPSIVQAGQEWAQTHDTSHQLTFTEDPERGSGHDVMLILGTLQYLDYPLEELLGKLKQLPAYIIVNLSPMHPTMDFYTVQNMGFSFAPYHVMSIPNFMSVMQNFGYTILDQWQSYERDCHIPFQPQHDIDCYAGFCLQHSDANASAQMTTQEPAAATAPIPAATSTGSEPIGNLRTSSEDPGH